MMPGLQVRTHLEILQSYEKELIEAALAESNGKVAGLNGAAAKLGIPRMVLLGELVIDEAPQSEALDQHLAHGRREPVGSQGFCCSAVLRDQPADRHAAN